VRTGPRLPGWGGGACAGLSDTEVYLRGGPGPGVLTLELCGQDPAAPGLGVYSSWLGGLPGWLSGAWWFEKREMTKRQVSDMKRTELSSGRVAMYAPCTAPAQFQLVVYIKFLVVCIKFLKVFWGLGFPKRLALPVACSR
jgi:hypothetical protein